MNSLNSLRPLIVVRWRQEPQSTMAYPELELPQCMGRYRPGGSPSWFPVCRKCRDMEGFLIRGFDLNRPVSGATSALAGGATLAARWLHEPQPISNQPVWLGFPHLAGKYRPGDPRFRPKVDEVSCRDMEGYLIQGQDPVLPGCGGTSTLSREATLAARWLHETQPIRMSNPPVGLGLPHLAGRHRPGGSTFSSPGCWSCTDVEIFLIRG